MTLGITVLATVVNTVFGLAFALVLVRQRFWGKTLVDGLVDLPFAVSPIVAGLMLVILYGPQGWIGRWLEPRAFGSFTPARDGPGDDVRHLAVRRPRGGAGAREFGVEQEEVAHTLGAGRWRTFWSVTLPSIRWGVAYGVTLTVARSLGEFGAVLVVSGNMLGQTQTATLYIQEGLRASTLRGPTPPAWCWRRCRSSCSWGWSRVRKRLKKGGRASHDHGDEVDLYSSTLAELPAPPHLG